MSIKPTNWAEIDENGRLCLPPELAERYGFTPGSRVRVDLDANTMRLHRPVSHLAKLYLEPTNRCNLACITCMRNSWDVELGQMKWETFTAVLDNLRQIGPPFTVFFGGLGEPLAHPRTIEMVAAVKALGMRVELITNGTLLDEKRSRGLIDAGLDLLWVSIDGARPQSFADVRLGAELPAILENLKRFRRLRRPAHRPTPAIGINFVAMKRNIADLPEVLAIGKRLGATHFNVSNLLPHTTAMQDDVLYQKSINSITYLPSPWLRHLSLPKMDFTELTGEPVLQALRSGYNVSFAGNNLGMTNDVCTFIEDGSVAVGWDGRIAPCPPLMYNHTHILRDYERRSFAHVLGYVQKDSLLDLWQDPEYEAYRDRVHRFAFAPCTYCGGCEISRDNLTDCFSNPFPACGGCLWAQGFIRCP